MKSIGFDNNAYLRQQTEEIVRRAAQFGNKLYLEFGGKLMFDFHAARVLPGYDPNVKTRLLLELKEQIDIIICVHAGDIERKKMRADFGISYDADTLKAIDDLRETGLPVRAVVITRYDAQPAAKQFRSKLERRGIQVYCHRATRGYPADVDTIVSQDGYGANPFIETERPIVVVTGPGPGSGKLATCLNNLYHDRRNGRVAGYAKFETFPVWNLPLKHPVNIAYEAATADLGDVNLIDPFHVDAYGATAVNYNRDVASFPLLRALWERIAQEPCPYKSPTDMGVNRVAFGIIDDRVVREAAQQEVIRRFFRHTCEYALGMTEQSTVSRIEMLMQDLRITPTDRAVVKPARQAASDCLKNGKGDCGICCGAAIELKDGRILVGKNSALMHAASAMVLNAVKTLAEIPDRIHLLSPDVVQAIIRMKRDVLSGRHSNLNLDETLIALAISSASNPAAQVALELLPQLRDCEVHLTHIVSSGDEAGIRRLGLRHTCDAHFVSSNLHAG